MRSFVPAAVVLLVLSCAGCADERDVADHREAIVSSQVLFADVAPDAPGCTVAVSLDGSVVWADVFGAASLDPFVPMSVDTIVDIGSTSKQFTATAIALLAQRDEVDLDDALSVTVVDLPWWSDEVTLRQLVHHTSGIADYISLLVDDGVSMSVPSGDADALRVLGDVDELDFEPGDHFEYSNSNYFLLGQVVLAVTGDDLGSFLQREVFDPLGLDAVMDPTADLAAKATSYEDDPDDVGAGWVVADSPWAQLGDGGVQTTPTQLVRWATQYWQPTIGGDGIDALRFDGAVEVSADEGTYGFGMGELEVDGRRVLSHSGGWGGFVTTFVVDPEARAAVSATCTSPTTIPDADSGDVGLDLLAIWT